jgi:hypothetical protein
MILRRRLLAHTCPLLIMCRTSATTYLMFMFVVISVLALLYNLTGMSSVASSLSKDQQQQPVIDKNVQAAETELDKRERKSRELAQKINTFMHTQIAENNNKGQLDRRIILLQMYSGYGNIMYSVLSTFVLSLMTRARVVIFWVNVKQYVEYPLEHVRLVSVITNVSVPGAYKEHEDRDTRLHANESVFLLGEQPNAWKSNKRVDKLFMSVPVRGVDLYNYSACTAMFFELAANPEHYDTYVELGLVEKRVSARAKQAFDSAHGMDEPTKIDILFEVGFQLAHNMLNYLWRPSSELRRGVLAKYEREFFERYYVIGLQMRYEFLDNNSPHDTLNFIQCALDLESKLNQSSLSLPNEKNQKKTIKWFLATDNPDR